MRVAFTTSGQTLDDALDGRFGRAPRFLIFDTETRSSTLLDNTQNFHAAQGAGVQAAEHVAKAGVDAVVTGHCGPKAFRVLSAAGISVYTTDISTIAAALKALEAGELPKAEAADVEGHW